MLRNATEVQYHTEYSLENGTKGDIGYLWYPNTLYILRGVFLTLVCVLGTAFNAFMIVAIVPNRRLRNVRNILLVHLGAVGLAASLTTTLYSAVVIFLKEWYGGDVVCQIYAFLNSVFTCVIVWTITALSWDKYQTIASPLHHSLTATFVKMSTCFSVFWVSSLTLSLPPLFGANEFIFHPAMGLCAVNPSHSEGRWYTIVYVCAVFFLPFCIMIYCYAHIFQIARTQSSRIAATMLRMVSVIQAPIAPTNATTSLSMRGTKAMGTILQLVGSFVLTYIPYAVVLMYAVITQNMPESTFVSVATTLFQASPCTNASVYGLRNKILRASFYRYVRRRLQHACYKDRRRGSVKSLTRKSSSTQKLSNLNRKCQNGVRGPMRRTHSFQVASTRFQGSPIVNIKKGLPRPHSFSVMAVNGQPVSCLEEEIQECL
ncbi:short-wave-sensitive opsin 1-like [Haliotis rufescens]|uniref:short-wave-sensitive opsin 1-like n=1 Tax=Haliotis rufescens TaxID=6454 RepID=UPI001EB0617B|nr:short-wave-sensitive opsin 1-like [Haliotis rufescens]